MWTTHHLARPARLVYTSAMEGEKLGKYEIRRTLGRGAMGVVYEGWDPVIARKVAIKTVALTGAEDAEAREGLARFQREAQAAGRLQHPNIVGVFDYGETATLAYIVMEFVDGESLKAVLDRGERFPLAETVRVLEELLNGLGFSHERGVVHRDIKPANIMLTHAGGVKIADFGIARIESSSMTQAGTVLGTPAYMSPEQFKGEPVDSRTDIYSAGVVLYQLLTGEKPFEGSMSAIMHKVLTTTPPKPSELAVTAPPPFDALVAKAMAKRPDDRFASASAFAEALKTALAGAKPALRGAEETIIASRSAPPHAPPAEAAPSLAAPAHRSGLPIWIGAVVVLIVVVIGGLWLVVFKPSPKPPVVVATKTAPAPPANSAPPATKVPSSVPARTATATAPPATPPAPKLAETSPTPPGPTKPTASPPAPKAGPPSTVVSTTPPPPARQPSATTTATQAPATAPSPKHVTSSPAASPASPLLPPPAPPPPATEPASTTVTPAGPPQSAPVVASVAASPAAIAKALASAIAPIPCTLVNGSVATAGSVSLAGLAGNGAPAALHQALFNAAPTAAVNWKVTTFSGGAAATYCQVLNLLRPVAASFGAPGGGFTLGLKSGKTVLSDGDPIAFHLSMPEFPAWLTVDYFASDGSVAHLDPGPGNPARLEEAGAALLLHGTPAWTVGPPYGRDMIVAIASAKPLFATKRPESERASAYLPALAAALDAAQSRGEHLDGTAFLLETHEKPKP
ncbi:MAG: serine/threonine-protein kinase [Acetobacteraceae bacterium]